MTRPIHGGNLAWAAALANCDPSQLLDFSASISPLGPPPSVLAALHQALPHLRHYPDPHYRELRAAIAQHHQIPAESIFPGNGAAELLTWIGRALAQVGPTLLLTPAFADYSRAITASGGQIIPIPLPLSPSQPPWETLLADLPPRPRTLLINNPHNPTGFLIPEAILTQWLPEFDLVVIDEAFMDFIPHGPSLASLAADHPHLIVLRSLTKFYTLPGLRLGYTIGHPDHWATWHPWRDPWPVNNLAAAAAAAALQDMAYQQASYHWLPPARAHLATGLAALPGLTPFPGTANYLLVATSQVPAPTLQRRLLSDRILIRDCLSFPELGPDYFRLAVRTPSDHQTLLTALKSHLS